MALKLASTDVTDIKLGSTSLSKLMLGSTQVWPTSAPTYPAIVGTPATEFTTSMGATQTIDPPAGIVAGNLLLAFVALDNFGTAMTTASTGWVRIAEVANVAVVRLAVFAKVATGSDALVVTGTTQDYCASMMRITGHAVIDPALDITVATANSNTGNADPPNVNPGVARHWMWVAAAAVDMTTSQNITAMPSGYTQAHAILLSANSTSSVALGVATKTADTTAENPGTFTNNTQEWAAATIAIPADAVAPAAPTLNSAVPGNTTIALTWTPNASGGSAIIDYVIEQSPNGSTGWTIVADGGGTATTYTVTGLTNETIQYFRVYTVTAVGASASPSNVMSATPTASPWSPASIGSLYAWYDASDTASFTFSSGAIVSQWADKKGTRHLTNPTTAEQPNRSGTMNGLPVVTFDGGDDRLMVQSWSSIVAQPLTVYVVAKYTKTGAHQALINVAFNFETKRSSDDTHQFYAGSTYTSNAVTSNAGHVFGAVYGSAVNQQRIDGTQVGTTNTGTNGLDSWHMGRATHGGDPFGGAIAEVVICNAALSGADITSLETYLKTKWGIA
jgi:hypothetical protein